MGLFGYTHVHTSAGSCTSGFMSTFVGAVLQVTIPNFIDSLYILSAIVDDVQEKNCFYVVLKGLALTRWKHVDRRTLKRCVDLNACDIRSDFCPVRIFSLHERAGGLVLELFSILGDPGAVIQVGRKGTTKVFKYGRNSPCMGTDSHQTISKNSSECLLLIGHKKCFALLCPISEESLLSSFRDFVHDDYCLDDG